MDHNEQEQVALHRWAVIARASLSETLTSPGVRPAPASRAAGSNSRTNSAIRARPDTQAREATTWTPEHEPAAAAASQPTTPCPTRPWP